MFYNPNPNSIDAQTPSVLPFLPFLASDLLFVAVLIVILHSDDAPIRNRLVPQLSPGSPKLGPEDRPRRVVPTDLPDVDLGSRSGGRERERRVWREADGEDLAL
jgi:hypothetical protein